MVSCNATDTIIGVGEYRSHWYSAPLSCGLLLLPLLLSDAAR